MGPDSFSTTLASWLCKAAGPIQVWRCAGQGEIAFRGPLHSQAQTEGRRKGGGIGKTLEALKKATLTPAQREREGRKRV